MRYGASVLPCRIPACTCTSKKSVLPSFVMTYVVVLKYIVAIAFMMVVGTP